jgi:hypothetical protein
MKRVLVVAALALALVAVHAVSAPAGGQSVTPKQVAQLTKRVKVLEGQVRTLQRCTLVQAIPFLRRGGPDESGGYLYRTPGGSQELDGALDFADISSERDGWLLITNTKCATLINSG